MTEGYTDQAGHGFEPDPKDIEIHQLQERIAELKDGLLQTVNELESWNLTEGDKQSARVIVNAKKILRAAGYGEQKP